MTNSIGDIHEADCVFILGSNTTETHPIISLEVRKALNHGAKLIVADPRNIEFAQMADLHLRLKPGANIALINAICHVILAESLYDADFVSKRTEGFAALRECVRKYSPEYAEAITGVPAEQIREAARIYAGSKRAAILYTMGITQHNTGTHNVMALANLAMLCGHIGKPGTGVNPLRGQNNVQGACDMGGLPDVLTGYQKVAIPEVREKFARVWKRAIPSHRGLTIGEMFESAVAGKLKGMYILGENPVLSDPDADHVAEALKSLDFLVVQDIFLTETAELADVVLPGASFAEKDGTFTNTERRVQRVRKAIEPVGDSRADWEILIDLGRRLGLEMNYSSPEDIFKEICSLTPSYAGMSYERLDEKGLQWPCPNEEHPGTPILHTEFFSRGLGQFIPVEQEEASELADDEYPFILSTGRRLPHYHTGTMTRRSEALDGIYKEEYLEMNPVDAERLEISEGDLVRVSSRRGKIEIPARVSEVVSPGLVFTSFHFGEYAINRLTNPKRDPIAKIPQLKMCAVKIEKAI